MTAADLDQLIADSLDGRRLLDHRFYQRWERGEVTVAELGEYAEQYRHFEAYLPGFLRQLADALPEGPARDLVAANLADELGDPIPHVELFEGFASGVGAAVDEPSPAMAALLATYGALLDESAAAGLAGFVAYETQSADVARTKADGLRRHHGLDDTAVAFWEHHARVDARHGAWATEALAAVGGGTLGSSLRRGADAWWAFLDERELATSA